MTAQLQILPMSIDDLGIAVEWAAAEGWNPGLDDARAFHSVDPEGFLIGWLGDQPVSAISVVRHSDSFGFLGFYLCHPDHRGKGYGWQTWQAGMAHLGTRVIGLDGVPAQEQNYQRSGFRLAHYTQRYSGKVTGASDADCSPALATDLPDLLALDRRVSATDRVGYMSAWVAPTDTRKTLVLRSKDGIEAVGTIRACREGHKIGPLFASNADSAKRLIRALIATAGADEIMIDVPDSNAAAVSMVKAMGLPPIFSCARMYKGEAPNRDVASIFGETSFELG